MPENPTKSEKVKRHFSSAMTVSKAELTNIFQKIKVHVLPFLPVKIVFEILSEIYIRTATICNRNGVTICRVCLEKVVSSPALPNKVVNQEINNSLLLEMCGDDSKESVLVLILNCAGGNGFPHIV